jgi:lysophospholipase L1-like esterase
MRQVLETSLENGVIPVLSTLPEFQRPGGAARVAELNGIITRLAREYDVPLWDYHAALEPLPNHGLSSDGVHPSFLTPSASADFTPQNLQYGQTVRNLTALQALDLVWRAAIREP